MKNLLIVMSDEHQARALGCAGHFAQTPNLDALAARGVRFTRAYTPSPICVPARAAFATGRYAHAIRCWDNALAYHGQVAGWGHALQAAGARVESIGKLHYRRAGDAAGFDIEHAPMHIADGVGMVWASVRDEKLRRAPGARMLGDTIGPGTSSYTRYDARVTDLACAWLAAAGRARDGDGDGDDGDGDGDGDDGDARPWCLFVGLVAPHFPLIAPARFYDLYPPDELPTPKLRPADGYRRHPWVEKQNALFDSESSFVDDAERRRARAAYYGLVSWADHNVGRILGALDAAGLARDTAVIYTSDHGDNAGARGLWGKSNMYEEAAAVPLIFAPAVGESPPRPAGAVCATPVSLLDVSETILRYFDARLDGDGDGDDGGTGARPGRPLQEILAAADDPARPVFSEYHAAGAVSGAFMLRAGRYKYIHYEGFAPELFDLTDDPEETADLATARPQVVREMHAALREICDPAAVNAQAFADQAALIESVGGVARALKIGAPGATPAP